MYYVNRPCFNSLKSNSGSSIKLSVAILEKNFEQMYASPLQPTWKFKHFKLKDTSLIKSLIGLTYCCCVFTLIMYILI